MKLLYIGFYLFVEIIFSLKKKNKQINVDEGSNGSNSSCSNKTLIIERDGSNSSCSNKTVIMERDSSCSNTTVIMERDLRHNMNIYAASEADFYNFYTQQNFWIRNEILKPLGNYSVKNFDDYCNQLKKCRIEFEDLIFEMINPEEY